MLSEKSERAFKHMQIMLAEIIEQEGKKKRREENIAVGSVALEIPVVENEQAEG